MPVTTPARTLLDLAATAWPAELERALAQAERLRIYDHAALEDVLVRAGGHHGRTKLERAIAGEPALTRSELEARFLDLVRAANLPPPRVNSVVDARDHGPCEVDFHWPRHDLVVETDGYATHGTRAAFATDRQKDAALQAAGLRVVRFTWRDVAGDPATVARRLRALLDR